MRNFDANKFITGSITGSMMCTRVEIGQSACHGNSGGPLVIKDDNGGSDLQVGVVSWGIICAADQFPNVHAHVSQAYNWIQSEVCKGSEYTSEAGFDSASFL
jgi:trypsin